MARHRLRLLTIASLAVVAGWSHSARSQATSSDTELVAARELFNEGRRLEERREWSQALTHFEAVARVRQTPQVRFHIALCHMHTGRLVAALNGFQRVRLDASDEEFAQVREEATEHIAFLHARIPTVVLALPGDSGLRVSVDGTAVEAAVFAVPIPLDPGSHTIRVTAPGRLPFETVVNLHETEQVKVEVVLRNDPQAGVTPPPPVRTPAHADRPQPPPHRPKLSSSSHSVQPLVGWVFVGVGGAAAVGAGAAALVRSAAVADIDERCPTHINCDPSLRDTQSRADTAGTVGAVLGITSVMAIATGAVVIITTPEDRAAPGRSSASLAPMLAPGATGLSGTVRW